MAIDPANYPHLLAEGFEETSPRCNSYNCIAWAVAADKRNFWWPPGGNGSYWPEKAPKTETLESFVEMLRGEGYEECATPDPEPGYVKLALYANSAGKPTHAARQVSSTAWTHKIGRNVDIQTTLKGVEDSLTGYGKVIKYFRRKA